MKKSSIILTVLAVVIVAVAFVVPAINGEFIKRNFKIDLIAVKKNVALKSGIRIQLNQISFKRHWFSSDAVVQVNYFNGHDLTPVIKPIHLHVSNYPFGYVNSGLHFGTVIRGAINSTNNKYHAKFAAIAGLGTIKVAKIVVAPISSGLDEDQQIKSDNIVITMASSHTEEGKLAIDILNPRLIDKNKGDVGFKQIRLNLTTKNTMQKNEKSSIAINFDQAYAFTKKDSKSQLKEVASFANLHYNFNFTSMQLARAKEDITKYLQAAHNPHQTKKDKQALAHSEELASMDVLHIFASPKSKLSLSHFNFDDDSSSVNVKKIAFSLPILPKNATIFDYFMALNIKIDADAPEVNFDGAGSLKQFRFNSTRTGLFQSKSKLSVGNVTSPYFKIQTAKLSNKAYTNSDGLSNLNMKLSVKAINSIVTSIKNLKLAINLDNVNKAQYIATYKPVMDDFLNAAFGDFKNLPNLGYKKYQALVTNKLAYRASASADLPLGKTSANTIIHWPNLADVAKPSLHQIIQATDIDTHAVIPQGYVDLLIKSQLNGKDQVVTDLAVRKGGPLLQIANLISSWKQQGLIKANDNHYAINLDVNFKKGVAVIVNHKQLTNLQYAYLLYNASMDKEAKKVLLPLAAKHNATAEYYLALIAVAEKKDPLAAKYIHAAIKDGSIQAQQLKQII